MRTFYERYANILDDESLYLSPLERESITNYRNSVSNRGKASNDPLDILINAIGKSTADALIYALLRKSAEKDVVKPLDDALREWARSNPNITID